jgi:hypothetical protein
MAGALSDPARAHVVRISRREEVSARHPRGGGSRRRRERCSNARPTVERSTGVSPLARDTPRAALGVVGFAPPHNAFKNFFVVSSVSRDAPNAESRSDEDAAPRPYRSNARRSRSDGTTTRVKKQRAQVRRLKHATTTRARNLARLPTTLPRTPAARSTSWLSLASPATPSSATRSAKRTTCVAFPGDAIRRRLPAPSPRRLAHSPPTSPLAVLLQLPPDPGRGHGPPDRSPRLRRGPRRQPHHPRRRLGTPRDHPYPIRTRTPPKLPELSRDVRAFWFVFLGFGKRATPRPRRRRRRRPTTRISSRRTSPG